MVMQPLHEEHQHLLPHVEALRTAAETVSTDQPEAVRHALGQALDFLTRHLIPHAHAEDRALYPVVARILGNPQATATMSRDHVEVRRLTEELDKLHRQLGTGPIPPAAAQELRRLLYGLYALVKVHFAKEEEVYLPLLEARLTQDQAQEMLLAMHAAARELA